MTEDFLTKIVQEKKIFVDEQKRKVSLEQIKQKSKQPFFLRSFKESIVKPGEISLIAEIKQASPSKGIIRKDFKPLEIALSYQKAGARALSVLTEEKYFKGSLSDIITISEHTTLPILRKDFIIDAYQIYESYISGADAILLISEILSPTQLDEFLSLAENLKIDCLVEASSTEDLKKILKSNAQIIGINNRNLRTFEVDLETSKRLISLIPKEKIIVVESGIKEAEDIKFLEALGVNAVLIGETLLTASDIILKIKQLMG